jgi:hypothetical protein
MKSFINTVLVIATAILFSSCEDVIQVKLDEGAKLLVVDAFINDMRVDQKVRLTTTDPYFSGQNPPAIVGATVVLQDLTAGKSYNFYDNGNGDYLFPLTTNDTISHVDHTYKLEVSYLNEVYTAFTRQKRTTNIDSISVKFQEINTFNQKEGYRCTLWAFDLPGPEPDFYWIKSFRNDELYNKGIQINLAEDGANGSGADGFIFIPPIAEGITPFGEVFDLGDRCRVEIHSISKETYNFLIQVITQTTNSGLFATTPENVKTNILSPENATIKAIGWFNMASVTSKEKVIQ